MSEKKYYLQDTRAIVGNDMLWWAIDGKGYTTDLNKANVFTEYEAFRRSDTRDTDKAWPKDYIDSKARPAVDFQYVDYEIAMEG